MERVQVYASLPKLSPSEDEVTPEGQLVKGVGLYEAQVRRVEYPKGGGWQHGKLYVWCEISPGFPHAGAMTQRIFNVPKKKLGPGSALHRALDKLHGKGWRPRQAFSLRPWKESIWEVSIRTVTKDSKQRVQPEAQRYSVVGELVRCLYSKSRGVVE